MTYGVFVVTDAAGPRPVIIGPDTRVHPADASAVRWRLVAQTDDWDEANRLRARLHEQRERGEL